jgi:hypothetical protein
MAATQPPDGGGGEGPGDISGEVGSNSEMVRTNCFKCNTGTILEATSLWDRDITKNSQFTVIFIQSFSYHYNCMLTLTMI